LPDQTEEPSKPQESSALSSSKVQSEVRRYRMRSFVKYYHKTVVIMPKSKREKSSNNQAKVIHLGSSFQAVPSQQVESKKLKLASA
jgi:hypothetical protein